MNIKLLKTFCLLVSAILLNSCASVSSVANNITIESEQIPPDMAAEDFTIIGVLHGRTSYDKYLEKGFEENYSGKYILALEDEIADKYNDINKYRYILDYNLRTTYEGNTTKSTSYRYMILDRKDNTIYKRKSGSSFFAKEINAFLQALERVREK